MRLTKVGIVGSGTMGRRIAFGCALGAVPACLYDSAPGLAPQAVTAVGTMVQERVRIGMLPPELLTQCASLVRSATSLEDCVSGAEVVIEAVPEQVEVKRRVFAALGPFLRDDAIVVTNTSSIPGSRLADALSCPERFINMNFQDPDHVKVEVMPHPGTSSSTLAKALEFARHLGLVPILVRREILGYATNRVWRAVKKEVLFLIDQGYIAAEDVDRAWMLDWGTTIGPCGLMDRVGLDVVRDIETIYYQASGDRSDQPPQLLLEMIGAGKLGVKSGEGFYKYPEPAYAQPGWLHASGEIVATGTARD